MLFGDEEELDYHSRRAAEELDLCSRSADRSSSMAHLSLAKLHLSRIELVAALRDSRPNRPANRICRTDKES